MSRTARLHLFEGFGIELEYMLVDQQSLKVAPIADRILEEMAGEPTMEVSEGSTAWSNELVLHVMELKSDGPAQDLSQLHRDFLASIARLNDRLTPRQLMLLGTSMHPFFDPHTETRLWNAENHEIYQAYNRIFDCRGHGWANLQSIHINLPFYDDSEFGRLHAAIRLILPLLPVIAASSPLQEGQRGPWLDTRLHHYLQNQRRIKEIIGPVIPEQAFTEADYQRMILQPMYHAIAPHDPDGDLQDEWLNSRSAIARFQRHAIEIRLLDIQESVRANMCIIAATIATLQALCDERWRTYAVQTEQHERDLYEIFLQGLEGGLDAKISNRDYLEHFGVREPVSFRELWQHLYSELAEHSPVWRPWQKDFSWLLQNGSLAQRIVDSIGAGQAPEATRNVYLELAQCLREDRFFG